MTSQRDYLAEDLLPGMNLNLKNSMRIAHHERAYTNSLGAASLAVTLVGSLIGIGLLTAAFLNNNGLSSANKENLLAQVSSSPSITVLSPNGGEGWGVGETYLISWQINDPAAPVNVYLSGFDEFGGTYIADTIITGLNRQTTVDWKVPFIIKSGKYLIRVVANPDDETKSYEDSSDAPFIISAPTTATPSIKVLSPNGGENWKSGEAHRITWDSYGLRAVKIYIYNPDVYGSGSTNYIVPNNDPVLASQGYYDWIIPQLSQIPGGGGNNYRIRVVSYDHENILDDSDAPFTITAPSQPTCTPSTSCVSQYCKYGGDLKKCTITNTDCSTSSYTTGSCSQPPPPPPPTTLTCDATARAILDSVGGCSQLNSKQYPNIDKACCTLVTKETLLDMLEKALRDGRIDEQEKADLLRALDNYLSARG